jgi:hypothetical protein
VLQAGDWTIRGFWQQERDERNIPNPDRETRILFEKKKHYFDSFITRRIDQKMRGCLSARSRIPARVCRLHDAMSVATLSEGRYRGNGDERRPPIAMAAHSRPGVHSFRETRKRR